MGGLLLVNGGLELADLGHFFLLVVIEAGVHERGYPKKEEEDTQDGNEPFHGNTLPQN